MVPVIDVGGPLHCGTASCDQSGQHGTGARFPTKSSAAGLRAGRFAVAEHARFAGVKTYNNGNYVNFESFTFANQPVLSQKSGWARFLRQNHIFDIIN